MMPVITEKGGIVKYPGPDRGQDARPSRPTKRPASPSASSPSSAAPPGARRICVRASPCSTRRAGEAARYMLSPGAMLVGRGRPAGRGRRSARPRLPRGRQDPRHHRRSAARRRAVRGAQAQGECDHRQGLRPGRFGKDYKAKRKIAIIPDEGGEPVEYLVPKSKVIDVQEGDFVKRGDNLDRRLARSARHPRGARRRGAGRISRLARSRRSIGCRA